MKYERDCGRQKEKGKQEEKSPSKSRTNRLKNQSFHKCHQKGHLRRDCPKMKNGKADVSETIKANVAKVEDDFNGIFYSTLVVADELVNSWILDSSCSYHLCRHTDWVHSYSSAT